MAIRVFRLVLTGLLSSIAGATYMVPYRTLGIEEESASLLPDGTAGIDPVQKRYSRDLNYGAIIQRAGNSQNDVWSHQVRTRPPITRISSRRLQPLSALQGIEEEVQVDDDYIAEDTRPQGSADDAPVLRVAKLRRKKKEPVSKDRQRKKNPQISEDPSKADLGDDMSFRKTVWRPDAPEFVPTAHRRQLVRQVNEGRDDELNSPRAIGKEHILASSRDQDIIPSRDTDAPTAMKEDLKLSITNENRGPNPNTSKTDSGRAIERDHNNSASVLKQALNGIVYAYPKKVRKRGKGSRRETNLRRKRTESEPAGIGLNSHLNSL
ncbi:uncharacterized protein ACLA_038070 [Aspergillus clavatus NRRL 1]|uniref:Uncharacterized protein n=1 Tax=Aspergillus clavatus (strain ATCC 1007 / CBS 513.65 / DSM 816 / NCTC 3887 / NRRL 1 / QM 1276 / 107) TaxID=344612 RepID=A1CKC3_ASPCL|nr:uncharacterized protein ACLA_038070 [Aspergillus clavatus NRRL 1]EAW09597.1 conserved hypothetical protein [Aspergillus clavatus NRRL 1]